MERAEITTEGVLNAIAEFDALGRSEFLSRYGFNGARDYFLIHEGREYDSKAIVAVAHKWAPEGDGKALTALELSGGRLDAAKRLTYLGFTVTAPEQNANWSRDEHILALDLYMTNPASPPRKESVEVIELSRLLNRLGAISGATKGETFRNANGVYMKMMNFRRLDPAFQSQGKTGLGRGSKGEEHVWDEFLGDRDALRAAALAIKVRAERHPGGDIANGDVSTIGPRLSPKAFHDAFEAFRSRVANNDKGNEFRGFHEGVVAAMEDYKPRLRERALGILSPQTWTEAEIGSGSILRRAIEAIEIQDVRANLNNNLVFWQNRYGHANRDHRALLEAVSSRTSCLSLEKLLFDLYRGEGDEGDIFDQLVDETGGKYPLLAYLYFLKDMDRFLPIQPTGFDQAFQVLRIDLVTLRNCSWDNYRSFNSAIVQVQSALRQVEGLANARLIDAHSFCWLLVKLSDGGAIPERPDKDAGRVVGGREKSIIKMSYSIENTARNSNGQIVERIVKNKDLRLTRAELEKLIRHLLDLQENRCALTGIPFHFEGPDADKDLLPSPDRIDSGGHYETENLQIVCQFVNFWKRDTPVEEFKRLLELVRHREHPGGLD